MMMMPGLKGALVGEEEEEENGGGGEGGEREEGRAEGGGEAPGAHGGMSQKVLPLIAVSSKGAIRITWGR